MEIHETEFTPEIYISHEEGILSIKGKSVPENAGEFYNPIIDELNNIIRNNPPEKFTANFNVMYFNTSSAKYFYKIFDRLKMLREKGTELTINWFYESDDDDIKEAGQDYQELMDMSFNMIPI